MAIGDDPCVLRTENPCHGKPCRQTFRAHNQQAVCSLCPISLFPTVPIPIAVCPLPTRDTCGGILHLLIRTHRVHFLDATVYLTVGRLPFLDLELCLLNIRRRASSSRTVGLVPSELGVCGRPGDSSQEDSRRMQVVVVDETFFILKYRGKLDPKNGQIPV